MKTPSVFLLDVDSVLTDGKLYYTSEGKIFKSFGLDDHEALKLLKPHLDIHFLSADHRGFEISQDKIEKDMQFPLHCVSPLNRPHWIKRKWDPDLVIYMGGGIFDFLSFHTVGYGIAPSSADLYSLGFADYVTPQAAANRSAAQACFHILEHFFHQNIRESFLEELCQTCAS